MCVCVLHAQVLAKIDASKCNTYHYKEKKTCMSNETKTKAIVIPRRAEHFGTQSSNNQYNRLRDRKRHTATILKGHATPSRYPTHH